MRVFLLSVIVLIVFLFANKSDSYISNNNSSMDSSVLKDSRITNTLDSADYNYICKVIIKKYPVHCARGSSICEKCKEYSKEKKFCLIGVLYKGGKIQRPMIQLNILGTRNWYEFDQFEIFDSETEAIAYSKENSIKILEEEK